MWILSIMWKPILSGCSDYNVLVIFLAFVMISMGMGMRSFLCVEHDRSRVWCNDYFGVPWQIYFIPASIHPYKLKRQWSSLYWLQIITWPKMVGYQWSFSLMACGRVGRRIRQLVSMLLHMVTVRFQPSFTQFCEYFLSTDLISASLLR